MGQNVGATDHAGDIDTHQHPDGLAGVGGNGRHLVGHQRVADQSARAPDLGDRRRARNGSNVVGLREHGAYALGEVRLSGGRLRPDHDHRRQRKRNRKPDPVRSPEHTLGKLAALR